MGIGDDMTRRTAEFNKRYYYPYCGWKRGFCMAENGCILPNTTVYLSFDCEHFRARHPITKKKPQGLR